MIELRLRPRCDITFARAREAGLGVIAADVLARRVAGFDDDLGPLVKPALRHLADPATLPDAEHAVARLARAVRDAEAIGLVTDYDVDGITSHALISQALTENFSHPVELIRSYIGHRLEDGYGLSDNLCDKILADSQPPAVVITADCGTSDGPRIRRLAEAGIDVIVTDHHSVPDDGVPAAAIATVNPGRVDGHYPDAAIAGCLVAWLLMAQLRAALVATELLAADAPKLSDTLDLVALGTVADAVSLFSASNRAVVTAGLAVLNRRQRPCWRALDQLLERTDTAYVAEDLGFQIGPRINARGRMADPFAALRFLQAKTVEEAATYLEVLDQDNRDRREMEKMMLSEARSLAEARLTPDDQVVCVFSPEFHPGVQGIVASRILEAYGRVSIVLSPTREAGIVSGSLRSVDSVDAGAALRRVARRNRSMLIKFGGHPKAAGVTLRNADIDAFREAFCEAVRHQIGDARLRPVLMHDGPLEPDRFSIATLRELAQLDPYGRGFEPPRFCADFRVEKARAVGADPVHLSLQLVSRDSAACRAIWFRALAAAGEPWPVESGDDVTCAFRLAADTWRGGDAVQLIVEYARRL